MRARRSKTVEDGSGHGQILHEVAIVPSNLGIQLVGERPSLLVVGQRAVSHIGGFDLAFGSLAKELNQQIVISAQCPARLVDKGSISIKE